MPNSNEPPVQGAMINQVRMSRLNLIANRLVNDDRINLYAGHDGYHTNAQANSNSLDTQQQQDDTMLSSQQADAQDINNNMDHFMGSSMEQFIMDDNELLGDDIDDFDVLDIDEPVAPAIVSATATIAPQHTNYQVIERPFNGSPSKSSWNASSTSGGSAPSNNLMSKLLHGATTDHGQQQQHVFKQQPPANHPFFDLFPQGGGGGGGSHDGDGSLFTSDRDPWAPNHADQGMLSGNHNLFGSPNKRSIPPSSSAQTGNVIERPFQRMSHPQPVPQPLFSGGSVGGVIDSPFSSWRTGHTHQPGMDFMYHASPTNSAMNNNNSHGYANAMQQRMYPQQSPQPSPSNSRSGNSPYIP